MHAQLERQLRAYTRGDDTSAQRVLLAAAPECVEIVVRSLGSLGASIEFRHDPLGYLRATLSMQSLQRIPDIGGVDSITTVQTFDELVQWWSRSRSPSIRSQGSTAIQPPTRRAPDASLPLDNPYTDPSGMGLAEFRRRHPTFDGRGVTVAVIDSGIDPTMPQMQTASALNGRPTRKIVDIFTALDPRIRSDGSGWVQMSERVESDGLDVTFRGARLKLPKPGSYRIGTLSERDSSPPPDVRNDYDGDGNPPGSAGVFHVLWSTQSDTVWVDTNGDGDFSDERPMQDYARRFDVGVFRTRTRDPSRPAPVAFAVQTDRVHDAVAVLVGGRHMAMSSSSAVGHSFFNSAAGGVAPAAALVSASTGNAISGVSRVEAALYASIEALIAVAAHPKVDAIMYYPVADLTLNDGSSVYDVITARIVNLYRTPIAQAAGNSGPLLGSAVVSGTDALLVGAFTAKSTWIANYAIEPVAAGYVRTLSGRGPTHDGAVAPSILAPIGWLAGDVTYMHSRQSPEAPTPYPLSDGYQRGGGTSQATPTVTGAMALLISAAKQSKIPYDARRIETALLSTAQPVPGFSAHEQGAGVVQMEAAWEMLQRLEEEPPQIESEGPVRASWSDQLARPHRGRGLYEREGWREGQQETRIVTFKRTSGPRAPRSFKLAWRLNDGTFATADNVTLPLDIAVPMQVTVAPKHGGAHSALLQVIDLRTGAVFHQMLMMVIVAEPLTRNPFVRHGHLEYLQSEASFFAVPSDSPRLEVKLRSSARPVQLSIASPVIEPWPDNVCSESGAGDSSDIELRCVIDQPAAGVWEAHVQYPGGFDPVRAVATSITYSLRADLTSNAASSQPRSTR